MNIDLRNLDSNTAAQIEKIKKDNHLATNKAAALIAINEFNRLKEELDSLEIVYSSLKRENEKLIEQREDIKEVFKSFLT